MTLCWRTEHPNINLLSISIIEVSASSRPCTDGSAVGSQCSQALAQAQVLSGAMASVTFPQKQVSALTLNQGFAVDTIIRHLGNCEGIFVCLFVSIVLMLVGPDQHRVVKIHTTRESEM